MNNITQITEMVVELVKSQLDEGVTLTAIEQTTRTVLQEIGRQTVEMTLKTMNNPYPEPTITCGCGAKAAYVRQRPACLHTIYLENCGQNVPIILKTLEKFDVTNQHICEMNRGMKNYTNISNPYWKISTTSAL